jgi:hypothetical protein
MRWFKKSLALVIGFPLLIVGVITTPLPWPFGFGAPLTIVALLILSTQIPWFRRVLQWVKSKVKSLAPWAERWIAKAESWTDRFFGDGDNQDGDHRDGDDPGPPGASRGSGSAASGAPSPGTGESTRLGAPAEAA